jgi:2-dehydro-3-deoxyphosphogluconate aldolase / (4S)-4-hydroxy-2-oxoglutarate aldolase
MGEGHSLFVTNSEWFEQEFLAARVMAVLRGYPPQETARLANLAWDIGCTHVEIPIEVPEAVRSLEAAVVEGKNRAKVVGAGTIIAESQVEAAQRRGAAYLVSPGLDRSLITFAQESGLPFLPGVATSSEILAARSLGFTWLKAFPASLLSAKWFSAMRGPFPDIRFVATGGVSALNARHFLEAGVKVVGVSTALDDAEQVKTLRDIIESYE